MPPSKFSEEDDDAEVIDALFREIDINGDGFISPQELQAALARFRENAEMASVLQGLLGSQAQVAGEQPIAMGQYQFRRAFESLPRLRGERVLWARGLGLEGELARLLRPGQVFDGLRGLKDMDEAEREEHICEVCWQFGQALPALLRRGFERLEARPSVMVREHINSKFCFDGALVGHFGTLDDFFSGPEKLIGTPNPKIDEGMEAEHCRRGNCENRFTTAHYNITTWPKLEWEFVVDPKEWVQHPHTPSDRSKWPEGCGSTGKHGRDAVPLDAYLDKPEVKRAGLIRGEVIGMRLFTGPMQMLYNAVFRGFADRYAAALLDKAGRENRYETTLFVIASGLRKLSKITKIPGASKVYRSLGDVILPRKFWEFYAECQITFEVAAEDAAAVADVVKSIKERVSPAVRDSWSCRREAWDFTEIGADYLEVDQAAWLLPTLTGGVYEHERARVRQMASKGARVVKEARAGGCGVRMTVALPVARRAFVELYQTAFLHSVRALCCGRDIAVTDVADNPFDFRGGGAWPCRRRWFWGLRICYRLHSKRTPTHIMC